MVSLTSVIWRSAGCVALACLAACAAHPERTPKTAAPSPPAYASGHHLSQPRPAEASVASEPTLDDSGESEAEAESNDEPTAAAPPGSIVRRHPLDGWTDAQIEDAVAHDLTALGPMSVGTPNAGALVNGVQAKASDLYVLVNPSESWGTQETIDYLNTAVQAVHDQFPDTPPLELGDIGVRHGGHLSPHISHQAGRDLDISFYYRDGTHWYVRGTRKNLDFPRIWAFVRAIISKTDIEMILLDRGLQAPLKEYALSIGEDPEWVEHIFPGKSSPHPIFRHAPGHATHLHLRFFNPIAQETARRAYAALVRHKLVAAPERYELHTVKKNETLGMIARKYGSNPRAIREANHLRSNLIQPRAIYRIPVSGGLRILHTERVRIPARRIPPPRKGPDSVPPSPPSASE